MGKLDRSETGFGAAESLLILVILAIIGFTGWYVWHTTQNTDRSLSAPASSGLASKATSKPTPTPQALPKDWQLYKDDSQGIQFGYPKEWGTLQEAAISTSDSEAIEASLRSTEYTNPAQDIQGTININFYNKSTFTINPEKYGATIKPIDGGATWQVTAVNPVAADKYKVGDIYNLPGKQDVVGGTIYLISSQDEGCTFTRYELLLKNTDAELSVPSLCSTNGISSTNQAAYDSVVKGIVRTIKIY